MTKTLLVLLFCGTAYSQYIQGLNAPYINPAGQYLPGYPDTTNLTIFPTINLNINNPGMLLVTRSYDRHNLLFDFHWYPNLTYFGIPDPLLFNNTTIYILYWYNDFLPTGISTPFGLLYTIELPIVRFDLPNLPWSQAQFNSRRLLSNLAPVYIGGFNWQLNDQELDNVYFQALIIQDNGTNTAIGYLTNPSPVYYPF